MTNYPIADFLIRLNNARLAKKKEVVLPGTKLIKASALALKKAGYLDEVSEKAGILTAKLTYQKKAPLMLGLKIISRPGLRIYKGADELAKIKSPSIFLISSSKGVISSREAIKERLGGEVIAEVW
jgi:small subunit ribosomal protein S8